MSLAVAIPAVINAIASGIGLIDKIYDQVVGFLSREKRPAVPEEHKLKIEERDSEVVASYHGQVVKTITAADLQRLPEPMLRHIMVLEKSMQNHYDLWAAVYPQRDASPDPLVNAKVDQQLKGIVSAMKDDLFGILSFLESCGIRLDDHYVHIRHLVGQV
jgi:hypothetical protein